MINCQNHFFLYDIRLNKEYIVIIKYDKKLLTRNIKQQSDMAFLLIKISVFFTYLNRLFKLVNNFKFTKYVLPYRWLRY